MNNDNNISNEDNDLNEMAPKLSKLKSNNPLCHTERLTLGGVEERSASNVYFDAFTSKLQNRIDDEEEIKAFAPTLLSIDKYNPFEVPPDYFEELPTIVQERVIQSKNTSSFEWLFLLFKPRFAIPFIAIICISFAGIYYMNNQTTIKNEANEELSLEDHLYYIDEADIVEQLTADASTENENISDDENSIENYLLENNIEESNLHNEL